MSTCGSTTEVDCIDRNCLKLDTLVSSLAFRPMYPVGVPESAASWKNGCALICTQPSSQLALKPLVCVDHVCAFSHAGWLDQNTGVVNASTVYRSHRRMSHCGE